MDRYPVLRAEGMDEISRYYGFTVLDFEPMAGGASNSSYLLSTRNEKLVVTIFGDKSLTYVSRLEKLLKHLAVSGFPTNRIVSPEKDKEPVMVFGETTVLVKEYIPGDVHLNLDKNMLVQVGSVMGELHQISAPEFLTEKHAYDKQLFPAVFKINIDPGYEEWLADRYAYLNQCFPIDLPKCLIHGDLFMDNIVFENNKLEALIDFEDACHYYRVFDLGMGIVGMCTDDGKIDLDKAGAFIRGYQQVQSLEEVEKNHLQLFVEYAAIATSYWRFWKYNIHEPVADKAELHMQMVEIAKDVNAIPREEFIDAIF